MEKVDKLIYESYSPVRLYLEDLMEIIDIFESNFTDYKIIIDGYKLENISEINKNETNDFEISAFEG